MFSRVLTAGLFGLESEPVWAELDVGRGMPNFQIVGLANQSVKEAAMRIHSAVTNCGLEVPAKRVTVNLTPANRTKQGSHYDLPIAAALLISSKLVKVKTDILDGAAVIGELSLDGKINAVEGVLPMIIGMQKIGIRKFILPKDNLSEGMLAANTELIPLTHLKQLVAYLEGREEIETYYADGSAAEAYPLDIPDFSDIRGQQGAKRAAQVAAAGMHGLLMIGPPGTGKSLIGQRIAGILPPMSYEEQMEVTQIYSVAGLLSPERPIIKARPFRAPHHGMSATALTGGGSRPRPGEISLAHRGVLFLDELPEFAAHTLDMLRQPMETGSVLISRAMGSCVYPADFMLVAAMNPCRCGFYGDPVKPCTCSETMRKAYIGKVSGPLLDRIDIHVAVERIVYDDIAGGETTSGPTSDELRKGVEQAFEMQKERYKGLNIKNNSEITPSLIDKCCPMNEPCRKLLKEAFENLSLSVRAYHKIIKVARSAADIDGSGEIKEEHVLEALSYRKPERYFS